MKITKKVEIEKVVGFICDACGFSCAKGKDEDKNDIAYEYATLKATWGYFSNKDRERHETHLCEDCYDRVRGFIEGELKGRIRIGYYDMLTGEDLGEEECQS
jgi:protein-arginine kinase activator protein McsA